MTELKSGDSAPDFEGLNDAGETVRLSDLRGRKVVLYFYPKDETTGCTTQACAFRDSYPEIVAQDAVVLGVSPDGARSHQKFHAKYDLPFPLIVDADHKIATAYDVWCEKSMYGRTYMGILRSHFVIDEDGVVRDARYNVKAASSAGLSLETLA